MYDIVCYDVLLTKTPVTLVPRMFVFQNNFLQTHSFDFIVINGVFGFKSTNKRQSGFNQW